MAREIATYLDSHTPEAWEFIFRDDRRKWFFRVERSEATGGFRSWLWRDRRRGYAVRGHYPDVQSVEEVVAEAKEFIKDFYRYQSPIQLRYGLLKYVNLDCTILGHHIEYHPFVHTGWTGYPRRLRWYERLEPREFEDNSQSD
jgi:hypothetical protein